MTQRKQEIITFKVDQAIWDAMRGISNRSNFIRNALQNALGNTCPLCRGSGVLTHDQRNHWDAFAAEHSIEECDDCHAVHLVCADHDAPAHQRRTTGGT